ncbi:ParB/RepB/Spo0J family partition protein [Streptomyces sp. NPDC050504]|uniref:ParB/RepB/Spo0J family partition protein n=1 Tax=Streptomyces sp. NPDC050504 TaxID=3365618 RepID=UPI0037A87559
MTAGRRTSLASLAGQRVDDVPGKSDPLLLTLPLSKLVPTRFNPRRNFGSDDDLRQFGSVLKRRQLQPAVVVSRASYLKLWPEEEGHLGSASYVIVNGERRFRASRKAGLPTLNVVHNETIAATRAEFLDALLSENNDRENLDPIERAIGVQTMVDQLGGKGKVAAYYNKSAGWVTQQIYLLKLAPELQALVSAGELPVRETRDLVKLPHQEQWSAWERRVADREAEKAGALVVEDGGDSGHGGDSGDGGDSATVSQQAPAETGELYRGKAAPPADSAPPAHSASAVAPVTPSAAAPVAVVVPAAAEAEAAEAPAQHVPDPRNEPSALPDAPPSAGFAAPAEPAASAVSAAASLPSVAVVEALPWGNPLWFDMQLRKHMTEENRQKLVWLLQGTGNA